ncbi:MAG: hypothetical protein JO323_20970 [Acidobacteriia bacterium]|nr:hypothetical protein [Terriglobia bacterium]
MKGLLYSFLVSAAAIAGHAATCDPQAIQGAYGFLLTGETTISGAAKPVASAGRLAFDGSGNVTGAASTAFTGLVLGNPVMGKYEAGTDCSVSWSLQDDSGNWQHFAGSITEDGKRISFRQTDPGGAPNGSMVRSAGDCTAANFKGRYSLNASGNSIDVDSGRTSGPVSVTGIVEADGAGTLLFSPDPVSDAVEAGTFELEDGCWVHLSMELPAGGDEMAMQNFRAVLVNEGKELIGIQIDPGTAVTLRLSAR